MLPGAGGGCVLVAVEVGRGMAVGRVVEVGLGGFVGGRSVGLTSAGGTYAGSGCAGCPPHDKTEITTTMKARMRAILPGSMFASFG